MLLGGTKVSVPSFGMAIFCGQSIAEITLLPVQTKVVLAPFFILSFDAESVHVGSGIVTIVSEHSTDPKAFAAVSVYTVLLSGDGIIVVEPDAATHPIP